MKVFGLQGDVYRLARRLLLSPDAAEDVTQETFLRVWRAAGSFRQSKRRFHSINP